MTSRPPLIFRSITRRCKEPEKSAPLYEALGFVRAKAPPSGANKLLEGAILLVGGQDLHLILENGEVDAKAAAGGSVLDFAARKDARDALCKELEAAGWKKTAVDGGGSDTLVCYADLDAHALQLDFAWDGVSVDVGAGVTLAARGGKKSSAKTSSKKKKAAADGAVADVKAVTKADGSGGHVAANERFDVADYSATGARATNEDAHAVCLAMPGKPDVALFGVFDGHGGAGASKYAARHMASQVSKQAAFGAGDYAKALTKAFVKVDARYLDKYEDDGTTAVVAVVDGAGTVTCANVGDSRCYVTVAGSDEPVALSRDHKPEDPVEKARIEKANHDVVKDTVLEHGKRVHSWRVDGVIAVARSIGDANFKDSFDLKAHEQALTCVPEVMRGALAVGEFLLLACDGIWDVMEPKEAVAFIREQQKSSLPLGVVAERLTALAIEKGSDDNCSVVIVKRKK